MPVLVRLFCRAFHSPEFYREVHARWRGACLGVLFLLCFVEAAPVMVRVAVGMRHFAGGELATTIAGLPTMTFAGGTLTVNPDAPKLVTIRFSDGVTIPVALIDTTGAVTDVSRTDAHVLMTRNNIQFKQDDSNESLPYDFDLALDAVKAQAWADRFFAIAIPVAMPLLFLATYLYRLLFAVAAALGALLLLRAVGRQASFVPLLRMAAISLIPAVSFATIAGALGLSGLGPVDTLLSYGYTLFALLAVFTDGDGVMPGVHGFVGPPAPGSATRDR